MEIEFCCRQIFEIKSSVNLTWGHVRSHNKFPPIGSAVYWIQANKQADKQVSVYIDTLFKKKRKRYPKST